MNNIMDLPDVCLVQIFRQLSSHDVVWGASQTCKRWRRLCEECVPVSLKVSTRGVRQLALGLESKRRQLRARLQEWTEAEAKTNANKDHHAGHDDDHIDHDDDAASSRHKQRHRAIQHDALVLLFLHTTPQVTYNIFKVVVGRWQHIEELHCLDINSHVLQAMQEGMPGLRGLRTLLLRKCMAPSLPPLDAMSSTLETIDFTGSSFNTLAPLTACTSLRWLSLKNSLVRDLPPLPSLQYLNLTNARGKESYYHGDEDPGMDLSALGACAKLRTLRMSRVSHLKRGTALLRGLAALKQLERVSLPHGIDHVDVVFLSSAWKGLVSLQHASASIASMKLWPPKQVRYIESSVVIHAKPGVVDDDPPE